MDSERGGPLTGFLISIGAIVVFFGLLAVACGACTTDNNDKGHSLGAIQLVGYHNDCRDDGYCGGEDGSGNGNRGYDGEGGKSGDNDQRGDHNCRNFCVYVPAPPPGQQPQGFIPPNPGKIPQQIADFVKVVGDFVQAVMKFAV